MPLIQPPPIYDNRPKVGPSAIGATHTPTPVRSLATEPSYKATAIDTRYQDRLSVLSHIEGSPWTVDWYSQVLGRDSAAQGQQQGTKAVHQQYHVIVGMEIRVQSELNHSQDQTSGESTYGGSSVVYPFLVPNKGDIFTAELFDGSLGIFELTSVGMLSVMREACHTVEYIMVGMGDKERIADLLSKVIQESYFVKDFIYHGQNPILVKSDYDDLQSLQRQYYTLVRAYMHATYSKEYATLVMPGQVEPTYDRFLVQAVHAHFDHRMQDDLKYVRLLNVEDDPVMRSMSLWDVLKYRERDIFNSCFTKIGWVDSSTFTKHPIFEGIRWSGIKRVFYPMDPLERVDNEPWTGEKAIGSSFATMDTSVKSRHWAKLKKQLATELSVPEQDITDEQMYKAMGIKPLFQDDYYIFSKAFYDNDKAQGAQSILEATVNKFIDRKAISFSEIRWLADRCHYWSPCEVYFYLPVLIILIRAVIQSI